MVMTECLVWTRKRFLTGAPQKIRTAALLAASLIALALPQVTVAAEERRFAILAVNDVYRIDGLYNGRVGGPARLRSLRRTLEADYPDLLLLHAGDIIAPSFLSRSYRGEQMIDILNLMDGDGEAFDHRMFATFGNHEFDRGKLKDAADLNARIAESRFTWLGSNIRFASGPDGRPLVGGANLADSLLVESGGVQVGLFGLTIDSERPAYVVDIAEPIGRAERLTTLLRAQGAEFVVALTHLPLASDQAILMTLGAAGPNLIVGGHEHSRQSWPAEGPRIFKADADVRSASVIEVTLPATGVPVIRQRFAELQGQTPLPDPQVAARARGWVMRHSEEFCAADGVSADCLEAVLGHAGVELIAEEVAVRSRETNFGNWLADQALCAFRDAGAQVALINSGSLRLNQNIGARQQIIRRDLEELFQFPTALRVIEIDGKTLKEALAKSAEDWPGHGRWLQVAGLAFRHDPVSGLVSDVTLLTEGGPRPLTDDERVRVVTGTFLLDPAIGDQDGYRMWGLGDVVPGSAEDRTLRQAVLLGLAAAGTEGIAPEVEGRVCQTGSEGPCLAVKSPIANPE